MMSPLTFGRNIRALRESRKLTEYELSIQVDIDSPQLSKVELGKQLPTAKVAVNIANYFGVTLCDLFANKQETESETFTKIKALLTEIDNSAEYEHLFQILVILRHSVGE